MAGFDLNINPTLAALVGGSYQVKISNATDNGLYYSNNWIMLKAGADGKDGTGIVNISGDGIVDTGTSLTPTIRCSSCVSRIQTKDDIVDDGVYMPDVITNIKANL